MNTELSALVKGVLVDLDGAGALADWLDEHDRAHEAKLLRRRWKSWQRERTEAVAIDREAEDMLKNSFSDSLSALAAIPGATASMGAMSISVNTGGDLRTDQRFRDYVAARFGGVRVEDVPYWLEWQSGIGHAVSEAGNGTVSTVCKSVFFCDRSHVLPRLPLRICRACRKALIYATLKPRTAEGAKA